MKKIQISVLIATFGFNALVLAVEKCPDTVPDEKIAQYKQAIKSFGGNLKQELQQAIQTGGLEQAIDVCNQRAEEITARHAKKNNFYLGRPSLKVRNISNIADDWESQVLQQFEQRKAAGEPVENMDYAQVINEQGKHQIRYMKAIGTDTVCTSCHGGQIKPELLEKLDKLYPEDAARGFNIGDLRGGFSISENMDACE
jgi:hypothetical protein